MRLRRPTTTTLVLCLSLVTEGFAQPPPEPPADDSAAEDAGDDAEGDLDEADEGEEFAPVPSDGEETPPAEAPADGGGEAPPEEDVVDDESGVSDEELLGEGEDPARPPPAGKGVVWGVVLDTKHGEPAIEAPVSVLGTDIQVFTDIDGRYRLELPPGTYSIRVFYQLHKPTRLDGVVVKRGEVVQIDAKLEPEEEECNPEKDPSCKVETFEVVAKLEEASVESQTLERQRSAAVADGVARAEISKTPDSNAAEAAQRVPGARIVGGRFVYVRGLGERYANALLFGTPLPSPEPDRAAVPLDLFPSLVLDSVNVAKTFTPDYPGDFAGGSVRVETRGVPSKFVFNVSLSGGYSAGSTFKKRLDHVSSSTDWLGFDDGQRSLPSEVPRDRLATDEDLDAARALNSRMSPIRSMSYPDHSVSVVVGNGWVVSKDQKLGAIAAANYGRSFRIRHEELREFHTNASDELGYSEKFDYKVERGSSTVKWGGYGGLAYEPHKNHQFRLMALHSQIADDETSQFVGFDQNSSRTLAVTQLSWVERALSLGQLSGRHTLAALDKAEIGWDLSLARATREQPDQRDTVYARNASGDPIFWAYVDGSESGRHFFASQDENSLSGKLDYKQPFWGERASVKLGGLVTRKAREFSARRLSFRRRSTLHEDYRCITDNYDIGCPDPLFQDSNVGLQAVGPLFLEEGTKEHDAYDAELNVLAGYLMGDAEVVENLRLVAGARVELTDQSIDPFNQFGPTTIQGASLERTNLLPAAGLIFSSGRKSKARFSYGRTLARPQLRELAPFVFSDYFGGSQVSGYPGLELTRIDNYDMRFEYFPTLREVLAFSIFAKHFKDPIEPILKPQSSSNRLTYRNAEAANLIGLELEARTQLENIAPQLTGFAGIANLTLVKSHTEVEQTGGDRLFITNVSRPLVNQAPWVLNLALDYTTPVGLDARVLYNVSGKTLTSVGLEGLPDAYVQPFHQVDFVASYKFLEHWKAKATVENILDGDKLVTQGATDNGQNAIHRYKSGRHVGLGFSFTY